MTRPSIAHVINEFESFLELLDDAYWEASAIEHKDFIYDVIGVFSQEVREINKLSVQDHHYPYEFITEGIRRIANKVATLDSRKKELVCRTQTLLDLSEVLSNVTIILDTQDD